MDNAVPARLLAAARAVAGAGLSDAFGHVSARTSPESAFITPPIPLGRVHDAAELVPLPLGPDAPLPDAAPREGWLHVVLLADPAVGAVCRAQPPALAALAALGIPFPALTGHAAMIGPVAVHDDSRLIRDRASAEQVAREMGDATAIVLRGNGAVTRAVDVESAVAAMWVLERSAEVALRALAAGTPRPIPDDEAAWWRGRAAELLPRIAAYLISNGQA